MTGTATIMTVIDDSTKRIACAVVLIFIVLLVVLLLTLLLLTAVDPVSKASPQRVLQLRLQYFSSKRF